MMKAEWHKYENKKNSLWLLHKNCCFNLQQISACLGQQLWCCLFFYVPISLTLLDIRENCNGKRMCFIFVSTVFLWIYFSVIKYENMISRHAWKKACKPFYSGSILTKAGMCCYILSDLSNITFHGKAFSNFPAIHAARQAWQSEYEYFCSFYLWTCQ
jgi:hypothetical protein